MHHFRNWDVVNMVNLPALCKVLAKPQPLRRGFKLNNLLFLNDSASVISMVEYAVIDISRNVQVDSLTLDAMCPADIERELLFLEDEAKTMPEYPSLVGYHQRFINLTPPPIHTVV